MYPVVRREESLLFLWEKTMTVSSETNKVTYIGNGVATSFAIPFSFLEKEHLKVWQLLNGVQTERTDWKVSGGNLIFSIVPALGAQIVIMREVPLTQETDYRENEVLPAETLERDFDKLTMQVQQLKEEQERSIKVDIFSNVDPAELGRRVERVWNSCDNIDTAVADLETLRTAAALTEISESIAAVASVARKIETIANHIENDGGLYCEYISANDAVVVQNA